MEHNVKTLTQSEADSFMKFLQSKNTRPCSCENPSAVIGLEVVAASAVSNVLPSPHIELIYTLCQNCGENKFYNKQIVLG